MRVISIFVLFVFGLLSFANCQTDYPHFTMGDTQIRTEWAKTSDTAKTHYFKAVGTTGMYFLNRPNEIYRIHSKYDTTVLNAGDVACWHDWAGEPQTLSNVRCLVIHDDRGCPDSWLNQKFICVKCLRHVHVKETREVIKPQDRYTEALKRLQQ